MPFPEWGHTLIICILVIALIVLLTFVLDYYNKAIQCNRQPNIWCWKDYTCPFSPSGSWPGVEAVYNSFSNKCVYPPNGGLPQGCTCAWDNTQAAEVCKNTGNPPPKPV